MATIATEYGLLQNKGTKLLQVGDEQWFEGVQSKLTMS